MSFNFTPTETTEILIKDIEFKEDDNTLEPCNAEGSFYDLIPYEKDWCEITEGRDIFTYDFKGKTFSKVITNPPYRDNAPEGERKNICIKFIFRCLELCSDECWLLLNLNMLNSLTPLRLKKFKEMGFNLCFMRVVNIKKWYGRYYWICLSKNKGSIIEF